MKIAVTGGSGFLGRETVAQLRARGHNVVPISRGLIASDQFEPCDILDTARLAKILNGCEVVIHSAALSAPWGKRSDFLRQNVKGTASVIEAAARAKVQRLVHVSSSSVYFSYSDKFNISEDAELPVPANAYAESKQLAELEAQKFLGDVFIARPRGIYGPGDQHLLPRLLRVMQSRPLPLLRGGRAQVDITDVSVVADALCAMVDAPAMAVGTFNISHGEPIMISDLVAQIAHGLNMKARWRSVPMPVIMTIARALELAARIDPFGREPLVTRYGLGLFAYSHTLDISKARNALKWRPTLSLQDGLRRCFEHMRGGT